MDFIPIKDNVISFSASTLINDVVYHTEKSGSQSLQTFILSYNQNLKNEIPIEKSEIGNLMLLGFKEIPYIELSYFTTVQKSNGIEIRLNSCHGGERDKGFLGFDEVKNLAKLEDQDCEFKLHPLSCDPYFPFICFIELKSKTAIWFTILGYMDIDPRFVCSHSLEQDYIDCFPVLDEKTKDYSFIASTKEFCYVISGKTVFKTDLQNQHGFIEGDISKKPTKEEKPIPALTGATKNEDEIILQFNNKFVTIDFKRETFKVFCPKPIIHTKQEHLVTKEGYLVTKKGISLEEAQQNPSKKSKPNPN